MSSQSTATEFSSERERHDRNGETPSDTLGKIVKLFVHDNVDEKHTIVQLSQIGGKTGNREVLKKGQTTKAKLIDEVRTRGKKIMVTISSSFSVSAMVRPPSRGTIRPVRNAPTTW